MDWRDVQSAKMTEEIGLKQPVEYTEDEKCTIATHEAGHAVVAYLVGQNRKLEVLSIIKRRDALGLLAHSDNEERYTRTRSELLGSMKIAFGGMSAESCSWRSGPARATCAATRIAAQMVAFGMAGSLVSSGDRSRSDPRIVSPGAHQRGAPVERLLVRPRPTCTPSTTTGSWSSRSATGCAAEGSSVADHRLPHEAERHRLGMTAKSDAAGPGNRAEVSGGRW
jgi:hypothetical protein